MAAMRGGPRMMCSPYLTGSLALMLVLVTFNYWSVSTNNFDLVKEVKMMQTQLKTGLVTACRLLDAGLLACWLAGLLAGWLAGLLAGWLLAAGCLLAAGSLLPA